MIKPEDLKYHLGEIEMELMRQVPQDRADACCRGACEALNTSPKSRGR